MSNNNFWQSKKMSEFTEQEWESLCDNCGRCCLYKLEDEEQNVYYTNVICKVWCTNSGLCGDYANRRTLVPDCVKVSLDNIDEISYWMPETCAYSLLYEGYDLPDWHPLVSGTQDTVASSGIAMQGKVVIEDGQQNLRDFLMTEQELNAVVAHGEKD